jgi:hypothetical protein
MIKVYIEISAASRSNDVDYGTFDADMSFQQLMHFCFSRRAELDPSIHLCASSFCPSMVQVSNSQIPC